MLILHNLFSVIVLPRSQDEIKCDAKGFFVNLGIAKLPFSSFSQKFYQLLPEIYVFAILQMFQCKTSTGRFVSAANVGRRTCWP